MDDKKSNKKSKSQKAEEILKNEFDKVQQQTDEDKLEQQIDEQIDEQTSEQKDIQKGEQIDPLNTTNTSDEGDEKTQIDETNKVSDPSTLIDALNIPMEEAKTYASDTPDNEDAVDTDYKFQGRDENDALDDEEDDLNSDDDLLEDDLMFDDYKLMAEMGVEIIDLVATSGAMLVAKEWGNEKKYAVSDARKRKIRKPLELLLKKKGKKVPPEVMFIFTLLVIYAPLYVKAFQEKAKKRKEELSQNAQLEEGIPDFDAKQNTPDVVVTPPPPPRPPSPPVEMITPKKRGKDKKPRTKKGYKGNKNAKS